MKLVIRKRVSAICLLVSTIFALTLRTNSAFAQAPEIPVCTVDQNQQPLLKLAVDRADYAKVVLPSMRQIIHLHISSLTTYTVPFKTVWEATGLSQLFPKGLPGCCEACPAMLCAEEFVFKKVPS